MGLSYDDLFSFFFCVDSHAIYRVIRWFNVPGLPLLKLLPVRASAYILSLVNEQVGKGALSLYLLKQYQVPIWKAFSSMIYLGLVEIYQLLLFATIGLLAYSNLIWSNEDTGLLRLAISSAMLLAVVYFPLHLLYFKGYLLKGFRLREKPLFYAFRQSQLHQYFLLLLFKAPNMLGAMVVYTLALEAFNIDVAFSQMFFSLPLIFLAASLPIPFHAGGLLLWSLLYPELPEISAFALVMSIFFVSFNALIGVFFLHKVTRELTKDS